MPQPDYSLPPWEQESADPAKFWLQGLQQGASIQHAKNALDLQAQTTALETSVKQQQSQQAAMLEQEKLAQEHAYKTATLGLQQEQLSQEQQKIGAQMKLAQQTALARQQQQQQAAMLKEQQLAQQREYQMGTLGLKTQAAADTFLSQKAYQSEVSRLMQENPDMDESKASMTAWLRVYGGQKAAGGGMAAVSKALSQQAKLPEDYQPKTWTDPNTKIPYVYSGITGKFEQSVGRPDSSATWVQHHSVTRMEKVLDTLEKAQEADDIGAAAAATKDTSPNAVRNRTRYQQRQSQIDQLNKQIDAAYGQMRNKPQAADDWDMDSTPQPQAPGAPPAAAAPAAPVKPSNIKAIRLVQPSTSTGTNAPPQPLPDTLQPVASRVGPQMAGMRSGAPLAPPYPRQAAGQEAPLTVGKQPGLGRDAGSTESVRMAEQGNKFAISKMSAAKLVELGKTLGMTLYDDPDGKFRVSTGGYDLGKKLTRKKVEEMLFDAANEKQLTVQ